MKWIAIISLPMITLGCTQAFYEEAAHRDDAAKAAIQANVPTCTEARECEGMWSAARNWVTTNCDMKIQTMGDSFIETYNATDFGGAACRVTKDPVPAGGYSFHADVHCGGGCRRAPLELVADFQSAVRKAGDDFRPKTSGTGS